MSEKESIKVQVDKIYNSIVSGGKTDEKAFKEILSEYLQLKENSTQIIGKITGGLLTHCNYTSEIVLQVYQSLQSDKISKAQTCDDMLAIVGDNLILRESIQEYFKAGE